MRATARVPSTVSKTRSVLSLLCVVLMLVVGCASQRSPATPTPAVPNIAIDPPSALADESVRITLSGFPPGQEVTLRARMEFENVWESRATFLAGESGEIDLSTDSPVTGGYDTADPMGMFWSMETLGWPDDVIVTGEPDPVAVTLAAEVAGETVAQADFRRDFLAPGVTRHPVRQDGLVGTLFLPPGAGPFPGLIVLGGGRGSLPKFQEAEAALLAAHGYAALTLAYFGFEDLPPAPVELPLEHFGQAIEWLQGHETVDGDRIGVTGMSLGGQAALLIGSTYPDEIKAVVAIVPVTYLINAGRWGSPNSGVWTYGGEPLPFVGQDGCRPLCDEAIIPVERIRAPVLLVSGGSDFLVDRSGARMADIAYQRLQEHDHPYPHEHVTYEDAGHLLSFPYFHQFPSHRPGSGEFGTREGNGRANVELWERMLAFFGDSLDATD